MSDLNQKLISKQNLVGSKALLSKSKGVLVKEFNSKSGLSKSKGTSLNAMNDSNLVSYENTYKMKPDKK